MEKATLKHIIICLKPLIKSEKNYIERNKDMNESWLIRNDENQKNSKVTFRVPKEKTLSIWNSIPSKNIF